MKKLSLCFLWVLSAMVVYAEENKISMVTYFPVPYVAYNRVQAAQEMDIGLTENGGNLSLGTASSSVPLSVSDTTKVTVGNLNLAFNSATVETDRYINFTDTATPLSLGVANYPDSADLFFKNLRIKAVSNSATGTANGQGISSINTDELVVNGLTLFGKSFPNCASVNPDSNGNGQIAWKTLTLGPSGDGASVYLTCGGTQTCSTIPLSAPVPCLSGDVSATWMLRQGISLDTTSNKWERLGKTWFILGATQKTCGLKTKNWKCNLDANPPAWAWNEYWEDAYDTSACYYDYDGATRVLQTCSSYFADASNPQILNGWTVEGNVKEVKHVTTGTGSHGDCEVSLSIDMSDCKGTKYGWADQGSASGWTDYLMTPRSPAVANYGENYGGGGACSNHTCDEGPLQDYTCNSQADIDAGGSVGRWRDIIYKERNGNDWAHCRVYNGQGQLMAPGYDWAYVPTYKCKKRVERCVKTCRSLRMTDDGYLYFVNSDFNCD